MKYRLAFLLVLTCVLSHGQSCFVRFTADDVQEMFETKEHKLSDEIKGLVKSGKIRAYKDSLFKKAYSKKEWEGIDFWSYPGYIRYDTIDDVLSVLISGTVYSSSQPLYRFIRLQDNYIHYYFDDARSVFIDSVKLSSSLTHETKTFLSRYKEMAGDSLSATAVRNESKWLIKNCAQRLHDLVMAGQIKAYRNDSLIRTYDYNELEDLVGLTVTTRHVISEKPYEAVDSVYWRPFDADSIRTFFANYKVSRTGSFQRQLACLSISPQRMPSRSMTDWGEPFYFPVGHLYYISLAELQKHFSENEMFLLSETILCAMKRGAEWWW